MCAVAFVPTVEPSSYEIMPVHRSHHAKQPQAEGQQDMWAPTQPNDVETQGEAEQRKDTAREIKENQEEARLHHRDFFLTIVMSSASPELILRGPEGSSNTVLFEIS